MNMWSCPEWCPHRGHGSSASTSHRSFDWLNGRLDDQTRSKLGFYYIGCHFCLSILRWKFELFPPLVTVNNDAMNTGLQISV